MSGTATANAAPRAPTSAKPLALVVADATWFTTENLFSELSRSDASTLLLKCLDYRNALQRGWWPWTWGRKTEIQGERLWGRELILPSGWMKSFPRLGMQPIARVVDDWRSRLPTDHRLALVLTYPHYLYLRDMIRPDQTIYFNIDDYSQYWPHRAARVNQLERIAVRECDLTVCVSRVRCEELSHAEPHSARKVRYLPHGCPSWAIDPAPNRTPADPPLDLSVIQGPRLGYVGTLEDRVDWELLARVADSLPGASLVLVGRIGRDGAQPWQQARRRCLARPNVRVLGWKPQSEIAAYNRAFDVCLIPYAVEHPFNRVCNPTKIMDYMGSGRPVVATALPECRLHAHRIDVAHSHDEFVARVRAILAAGSDDGRSGLRHAYAMQNSCARVAERLMGWLG